MMDYGEWLGAETCRECGKGPGHADNCARGIEARRATDSEAGVVGDESPVGNADAPNLNVSPNRSGGGDAKA
jgi:hypothetical protein